MRGIQAGDLVVCVDDGPCTCRNCTASAHPTPLPVRLGAVYRVEGVEFHCRPYLLLLGIPKQCGHGRPINAIRFRKIDPLEDLDTRAAGKTFKLPKRVRTGEPA